MRYLTLAPWATCAVLALAGCKNETPPQAPPSAAAATAQPAPETAQVTPATRVMPSEIPQVIRGRWGLVPADCTSTKGDAKGLATIDAKSMKFYESVAKLDRIKNADDDGLIAAFVFTGEGQTWPLDVALEVEGENDEKLLRKDSGKDAMPGTLEYTRCAA